LRGFLSQTEEAPTQRAGSTQEGADEGVRQKDRKQQTVFGLFSYCQISRIITKKTAI